MILAWRRSRTLHGDSWRDVREPEPQAMSFLQLTLTVAAIGQPEVLSLHECRFAVASPMISFLLTSAPAWPCHGPEHEHFPLVAGISGEAHAVTSGSIESRQHGRAGSAAATRRGVGGSPGSRCGRRLHARG